MINHRLLAAAEAEMLDAAAYLDSRAAGLGGEFLASVKEAIGDIKGNPVRWAPVRGEVRRRLVGRFPYCILYSLETDGIAVIAVMHTSRRPDYWIDRMEP